MKTLDSQQLRTESEYDKAGRRVLSRDALGRETRYFHDERGNVVKTIFADDSITLATYDLLGRKIAETDQLGLTKNYEYDKQSRLTAVELPAAADPNNSNQLTRPRYEYEYDIYGNHTLIRDALGRETRFTFDEHGRQLTRTLPMGEQEEFRYNQFRQQVLHISFEGVVTETRYENNANGQGRVDDKRYFDNIVSYAEGAPSETVDYGYDSKGRLTSTTQASLNGTARTEQLTYGDEDRVIRIVSPEGALNYEYDAATGRQTRVTTGSASNPDNDFRYFYDQLGRLNKVEVHKRGGTALGTPETTRYTYNEVGNVKREDLPNGVIFDRVFDELGRIELLTHYAPDATPNDLTNNLKLAQFDYDLLPDGRRAGVTETFWSGGVPQSSRIDWTYDDAGRLVEEVFDHYDNTLDFTTSYELDLVGNRLKKTYNQGSNNSIDETIEYQYDDNDRLLTETHDLASGTDTMIEYSWGNALISATHQTGKTVTETASGNVIQTVNFTYNLQNRLGSAVIETLSGGVVVKRETASFEYGDDGIRVAATSLVEVDADSNPATPLTVQSDTSTAFLNEKQNPTGYSQVIEETTIDAATAALLKRVVATLGLDAVSQTEFTPGGPAAGVNRILQYDDHGSTRLLTDLSAVVLQKYDYDAFGIAVGFDPTAALTTLLYSGEQFDLTIHQQYLRARYYDPLIGRFERMDLLPGSRSTPLSLHKFGYVHMDPVNGVDPEGLEFTLAGLVSNIGESIRIGTRALNYANQGYRLYSSVQTVLEMLQFLRGLSTFVTAMTTASGGGLYGALVAALESSLKLNASALTSFDSAIKGAFNFIGSRWTDVRTRLLANADHMAIDVANHPQILTSILAHRAKGPR